MVFFFNDTATTEIYTLSLHDALPISAAVAVRRDHRRGGAVGRPHGGLVGGAQLRSRRHGGAQRGWLRDLPHVRSEEHTSELQSRQYLVCRLLLEKKKHRTKISSFQAT